MNIVIVEDELPALDQMSRFVSGYQDQVNIIGKFSTCEEIIKYLDGNNSIDVVFCDIELRDGNALTALRKTNLKTVIVFTTAYDQFWSESLRLNGIDYLLKPITLQKVHQALDKVKTLNRIFTRDNLLLERLTKFIQQKEDKEYKKRFKLRVAGEYFIVNTMDIIFFRIINGVIYVMLGDNRKYPLLEETLLALEEKLDPALFFRINRSDIININFIISIRFSHGNDYSIMLKNIEEKLIVSQSRILALKEWFK